MIHSWIDISCHPEVLSWFGLNAFNVPTVIYMQPKHNRFADLVGAFDFDTIREQEDRVTSGTLPMRTAPLSKEEMHLAPEC